MKIHYTDECRYSGFFICGISVFGMILLYFTATIDAMRSSFLLICVMQLIKSAGLLVATGYMWALVPEVVTFGEFVSGRRVAGIVTALICIFMKAGMALGGVIPGLVLEFVGFNSEVQAQSAFTLEGIVWLVTFIPALLMVIAAFVIGRYELSDKKMDEINNAITSQ